MLIWPLATADYPVPTGNDPGAFGVKRRGYIHTGVDLYCEPETDVYAIEDGIVVEIERFTGAEVQSSWWNDTDAILIEGESGVICYGEVRPLVSVGDKVKQGQLIAKVITVLKTYKGNPMTMLHFELHKHGTIKTVDWYENKPESLLNPTEMLISIKKCSRSLKERHLSSKQDILQVRVLPGVLKE